MFGVTVHHGYMLPCGPLVFLAITSRVVTCASLLADRGGSEDRPASSLTASEDTVWWTRVDKGGGTRWTGHGAGHGDKGHLRQERIDK